MLATATPDHTFPATAATVQAALGWCGGIAFDVAAVCSDFLLRLATADSMLRTGMAKCAQVIGAETFEPDSRLGRPRHLRAFRRRGRRFRVVRRGGRGRRQGYPGQRLHAAGERRELLFTDGGPSTTGTVGKVRMKGREVFRHAVVNLAQVLPEVLEATGYAAEDLDWVVPHQANLGILDATARELGLPFEKIVVTVDRHANTSAPLCRWRSTRRAATGASRTASWSCSRRWAAASPGVRACCGSDGGNPPRV